MNNNNNNNANEMELGQMTSNSKQDDIVYQE